jgi:gluconokinase
MADVFRREVSFPESYEGSCWGAAILGMKALGAIDSLDVAKQMTKISIRLYERLEPEFAAISRFRRSM